MLFSGCQEYAIKENCATMEVREAGKSTCAGLPWQNPAMDPVSLHKPSWVGENWTRHFGEKKMRRRWTRGGQVVRCDQNPASKYPYVTSGCLDYVINCTESISNCGLVSLPVSLAVCLKGIDHTCKN